MGSDVDAIIVGGGLAGLICARRLSEAGYRCQLLEASDQVGGRVRTQQVDGFLLDRGFQVFLTAYPEARAALDYERLKLRCFDPGALIRSGGKFRRLSDPWRRPRHLLATALSPAAKTADKLRIARFRRDTTRGELDEIYQRPEQATMALLEERGFSDIVIERFFRPFLGGVFLDRELQTSSRMCEFVFRMFSLGQAAIPQQGMAEIPRQLAGHLPRGVVHLNHRVEAVDGHHVVLAGGQRRAARAIVIATEAPAARRLLADEHPAEGRGVRCLYFAADKPPVREPMLVLDGEGQGPINNLCVPSQVSPSYAPAGQSLVSVTVLNPESESHHGVEPVKSQLREWFGPGVEAWRHLRTYDIAYALPVQSPPALTPVAKLTRLADHLFLCGDHCDTGSINGALASGRRTAEAVMNTLAAS